MKLVSGAEARNLQELCGEEMIDIVVIEDAKIWQDFLDTQPNPVVCEMIDSPDSNLFETLGANHGWNSDEYWAKLALFFNASEGANSAFWEAYDAEGVER